jgi:hypothetical protein
VLQFLVVDPQRPGVPAVAVLLEARRLHQAVEGHELDDDEPLRVRRSCDGTS